MLDGLSVVSRFERDGFVVLPEALSRESVEAFRAVWTERYEPQHERSFIVGNDILYEYTGIVLPAIANDCVLSLLEELMGPQVQLDSVAVTGVPGNDASPLSWHRDPYSRVPQGNDYYYPNSVHLLVYLQDMSADVGQLRVVPGSHRSRSMLSIETRHLPQADEVLVEINSGDGVLLHNQILHSRSPNLSTKPRLLFSTIYTLGYMKTSIDYNRPAMRDLIEQLEDVSDPRLLRLFGRDRFSDEKSNCGFLQPERELWELWRTSQF